MPKKLTRTTVRTYRLRFEECEHSGDLRMYQDAVERCSGLVTKSGMVANAYETGYIHFALQVDHKKFKTEFAKTDAYLFSSMYSL